MSRVQDLTRQFMQTVSSMRDWLMMCLALTVCSLPVFGEDGPLTLREIAAPTSWKDSEQSGRWITVPVDEWNEFQQAVRLGKSAAPRPAPVLLDAVYRAVFDGGQLGEGTLNWSVHQAHDEPGFIRLGQSSLSVAELQWGVRKAVHGRSPSGEWLLWNDREDDTLTGRWAHGGVTKLGRTIYDISLPPALSSRLEIIVPRGWRALIPGVLGQSRGIEMNPEQSLWTFDLGRQQTLQLILERDATSRTANILIREDTVYGLTVTDDLIRMRTDLDCVVTGSRHVDLQLAVPKTLRVFNVLLGSEVPLAFQRELGSEEDQLRIPLHSLQPGQRVTLRILSETQRRADRSFIFPRLRPLNAELQAGMIRLAVDRPLEVRGVETAGLRQTQLTEEGGQEIRTYEMTSTNPLLALQVGEPAAQLQGEVLFIADVRGEAPISRSRVRLSTREGELFTPQLLIPPGWDVISVELAPGSDIAPAAWQVSPGPVDDSLLTLELRQPVRPDRDCTLLVEMRSVQQQGDRIRRLPIPIPRTAQSCFVRGVVWDQLPWDLDASSAGAVELDAVPPDDDLKTAVSWTSEVASSAVSTGIQVPRYDAKTKPQFRTTATSTAIDESVVPTASNIATDSLLCASVEMETHTTRVGQSHPHRARLQFSHQVTPAEFVLTISPDADLARVSSDDQDISFVRQGEVVILDPAAKPFAELVLEYRTVAKPGWMIDRDDIVFPQLDCVVTDFAWHLILNPERMLYRLPLTAATTPRQQSRSWERFIGPLARHAEEKWFNPFDREDWRSLINGTPSLARTSGSNDLWLVAAQTPSRVTMKTWDVESTHNLAWCGFLGSLLLGVVLRRARSYRLRRGWIYLSGSFLVLSVFVADPYAPIAGGAFLGSVLAILIPRRFALGRDWIADRRGQSRSTVAGPAAVVSSAVLGCCLWGSFGIGQDQTSARMIEFFRVPETETETPRVAFSAAAKAEWNAWKESIQGPDWLLTACQLEVATEVSGPPRITGTFEYTVFEHSTRTNLKLPLEGVSLDPIEGLVDGQPVRLIPATDRSGFILPLMNRETSAPTKEPPPPPTTDSPVGPHFTTHQVVLKFRPLPDQVAESSPTFSATLPQFPGAVVTLLGRRWGISSDIDPQWKNPLAESSALTPPDEGVAIPIGPAHRIAFTEKPLVTSAPDNLTDVQIRTLLECGSLGADVQIGVLAELANPNAPAAVKIALPATVRVQRVQGPTLDEYEIEENGEETFIRLLLKPGEQDEPSPVEITGFLAGGRTGYQLIPPRWIPARLPGVEPLETETVAGRDSEQALLGVVAKPGFELVDTSSRDQVTPLSSQSFSDSLFAGMVWQFPDLAWNCSPSSGPSWTVRPQEIPSRGSLSQVIDVRSPQTVWSLDASVTSTSSIPFEHVFAIDPRIELQRATVQQDGADRLLRWKRTGDLVHLSIRDGQPGVQTVRIEGVVRVGTEPWKPLTCVYQSGLTSSSEVTVRNSPRTVTTLQWAESTITLDPQIDSPVTEYRYQSDGPSVPDSIHVESIREQRDAPAWLEVTAQTDNAWLVTFRTIWPDVSDSDAPIEVRWSQPGLEDVRLISRREVIRPDAAGETIQWRPSTTSSRTADLTLSATLRSEPTDHLTLPLPEVTGLHWKSVWVSLPRGSGYRPARSQSTLLSSAPDHWGDSWKTNLSESRSDLFSVQSIPVVLDRSHAEPLVRPILAETLVWMESGRSTSTESQFGVTKYLLISEREASLTLPETSRASIRAISVDGQTISPKDSIRIPSRPNDLSHEVMIWWQSPTALSSDSPINLVDFPGTTQFPHWIGVVPPHHQVLLGGGGTSLSRGTDFWLGRCEALLDGAAAFEGAPWTVDGPLLHALSDSRDELARDRVLTDQQRQRLSVIEQRWQTFSQAGGRISSPLSGITTAVWESGLDSTLSLCGESRSLWLEPDRASMNWPRFFDRRWAIALTAIVASLASLVALIWMVRISRKLDVAEKIAARPNGAIIGLGTIWWIALSPSVFGLVMIVLGIVFWARDRVRMPSNMESTADSE